MDEGSQRHAPAVLPTGTTRYIRILDLGMYMYVYEFQTGNCSCCNIIYKYTTIAPFHITKNSIIQLDLPILTKW